MLFMYRNRALCAAAALVFGLLLPLLAIQIHRNGLREPKEPLYILMYHDIAAETPDETNNWTTTTKCLREDLQWLRDNGYTAYLPCELAAGVPLSERAVMITFDDGYASNCTLALPLLREYGMKAAVAVLCERVERGADNYMTWDMCREMAASGLIEFGSHTYDLHADGVRRLSGESKEDYEARVFPDLLRSIETLHAQTGQEIIYFAYPNGERERWAERFLKEHFTVTVTTQDGVADIAKGLYNMRRCNVSIVRPAASFLPAADGQNDFGN